MSVAPLQRGGSTRTRTASTVGLEFWNLLYLMSKSDILLSSLSKFYEVPENRDQLAAILGRTGPSLRRLEWFVTNFSKTQHVTYTAPNGKMFTVHVAYKSSLDGYSKKLFDPFCRTDRIEFQDHTTTVAQLNFIRWCITNGVIDYIKKTLTDQSPCQTPELHIRSKIDTDCNPGKFELRT